MHSGPMTGWKLKLSLVLNFLVLAILLNSIGTVALQAQRTFGISASAAGMLAAFKAVGIVLASLLAASRLAQVGYRNTMLVSLAGLAVVCLIVPSAPDFLTLKILFVAAGAAFGMIKVAAYATVGLITTDRKGHASFMSFLESFFTFGIVMSYFLFGAFADDVRPRSTAWLQVFYVLAAFAGLAWVLLLTVRLNEGAAHGGRARPWSAGFAEIVALALDRKVMMFGGCIFLYVMVEQSAINWLPTFNHKVLNLPARLSIQIASILAAAMALGRFAAGFVLRRVPWFPFLTVCLLTAAGLVPLSLVFVKSVAEAHVTGWATVPPAAALFPLLGLLLGPVYPVINSVILCTLPVDQQGAMSGLSVIFSALGSAIGTIVSGYLFDLLGGQAASYFSLIPIFGLLACLFRFRQLVSHK